MLLLWALAVVAIYLFHELYWKRRNLPPGPTPLPVLGNLLPFILDPPGEAIQQKWGKRYDGVFTFWQGSVPIVFVTDYKVIMETFVKDAESYAGRGVIKEYLEDIMVGDGGVVMAEGETWKENRRFALQTLRNFGMGRNVMQEKILDEVSTLWRRIDTQIAVGHREIAFPELIDVAVGSIINALMFGYGFSDERLGEFGDLKETAIRFIGVAGHPLIRVLNVAPGFYKRMPVFSTLFEKVKSDGKKLVGFFFDRIKAHAEELERSGGWEETPVDFVMAYLQEKQKKDEKESGHIFDETHLAALLFDLWVAGQETTSSTIGWCIAYLIHHPGAQSKAHAELDRLIGGDRIITNDDKPNLPYVNAIVNESLRLSNLLPINLTHKTTRDVVINGHPIAKGTWISPQVTAVLYDADIYAEPQTFNPERFLDGDGKLQRADELIPFSIGKRQCLGEGLARMELFLFIANLLNRYRFSAGSKLPSLRRNHGVTVRAEEYKCLIERRF